MGRGQRKCPSAIIAMSALHRRGRPVRPDSGAVRRSNVRGKSPLTVGRPRLVRISAVCCARTTSLCELASKLTPTNVRNGSCVTNALSEYDGAELYER